ncbi:Uncharacterised protein [Bordetella pertussis]|nr:Uncharacterised protein [Bordetella pertussis]
MRLLGKVNMTSVSLPPRSDAPGEPVAMDSTDRPMLVAICCETRSRACSRNACAISWPSTAASSSSVGLIWASRPV